MPSWKRPEEKINNKHYGIYNRTAFHIAARKDLLEAAKWLIKVHEYMGKNTLFLLLEPKEDQCNGSYSVTRGWILRVGVPKGPKYHDQ